MFCGCNTVLLGRLAKEEAEKKEREERQKRQEELRLKRKQAELERVANEEKAKKAAQQEEERRLKANAKQQVEGHRQFLTCRMCKLHYTRRFHRKISKRFGCRNVLHCSPNLTKTDLLAGT